MDPISLGTVSSVLAKVATAVLDKINKLQDINAQETQATKRYKRALTVYARDAQDVTGKLEAIVHYGNQGAVAALMDSPGGNVAFSDLRAALADADQLLSAQEGAADALQAKVRARGSVDLAALLSDADKDFQRFNEVLGDATIKLDESRGQILQRFKQFSDLYEIHGSGSRMSPGTPSFGRKALDAVQAACYNNPFNIRVDVTFALEIAKDLVLIPGSRGDRGDDYSSSVKGLAVEWVEDHVGDGALPDLARTQLTVLQNLSLVLNNELTAFQAAGDAGQKSQPEATRCAHLVDMRNTVQKGINRETSKRFSLAFCGMVKAGKSLFLNALMGQMILPSDELPSTAWPCRVQHVKDQRIPSLDIDAYFFQKLISELQRARFGLMMANYQPPRDTDPFSALLNDTSSDADTACDDRDIDTATAEVTSADRLREIYHLWIDLHPATQKNLLKFEKEGYHIPERASGEEHVMDLLGQVNDVVRLCYRFGVEVPRDKNANWPVLRIDFEALRDETFEGEFEFIDLPGIGEHGDVHFKFEDLVRSVASEVNAVIPIVSFKEVSKESWRNELPSIVMAGVGHPPDLVLCTHLDQVAKDRVTEQIASVTKAFWPQNPDTKRVLCCASRMGFSARAVLRMSKKRKPEFKQIWEENTLEYECAEKILGAHEPEVTYRKMDFALWRKALDDLLKKSMLADTIKRLITDMIESSRRRALINENIQLHKQLHKAIIYQRRVLLPMRCSVEEREEAYAEFQAVKSQYEAVLKEWSAVSARMELQSEKKLQDRFAILQRESDNVAKRAVEDTANQTETNAHDELVFRNIGAAERFLHQVQAELSKKLSTLKQKFVKNVRNLANHLRAEHFKTLQSRIRSNIADDMQQDLREEIMDELDDRSSNVEALTFHSVRRKVMHTIATRHNAASAYHALQEAIAKPFLGQSLVHEFDHDGDEAEGIDELGFMLRAPIAVIAAVPWLLGAGIWPFMKRSEQHVLDQTAFLEELKKHVVRPFSDALKQEGKRTLEQMMSKSFEAAKDAVKDSLANEEKRFENERRQDKNKYSSETVASAVSTLLDFLAAESALSKIQSHLKNL